MKRSRLTNGGFWAAMFYAMSCEAPGRGERRGSEAPLTPLQIFYEVRSLSHRRWPSLHPVPMVRLPLQVLLSYLADRPLEAAMADAASARRSREPAAVAPLRTARRSDSAHYGVVRHALEYMLREIGGVSRGQYRRVSLMLRLQMLRLAQHDLLFVPSVSAAERTLLQIARRQLAHKSCKLAEDAAVEASEERLSAAELAAIRGELELLEATLDELPGTRPGETPPPPPLVLCEADAHLRTSSIALLLGDAALLAPPAAANGSGAAAARAAGASGDVEMAAADAPGRADEAIDTEAMETERAAPPRTLSAAELLGDAEVVGLYFSASWCPPRRGWHMLARAARPHAPHSGVPAEGTHAAGGDRMLELMPLHAGRAVRRRPCWPRPTARCADAASGSSCSS